VCKKKLKIPSPLIHKLKITKKIKNEKIMALQSVHGQKVKKMPHPTLGNCFENTQTIFVCCFAAFRIER
jgi:hypothetical protein